MRQLPESAISRLRALSSEIVPALRKLAFRADSPSPPEALFRVASDSREDYAFGVNLEDAVSAR